MAEQSDAAEDGFLDVEDAEYGLFKTKDTDLSWKTLTTAWSRNRSFGNSKEYLNKSILARNARLERLLDRLIARNPRKASGYALRAALPWRKDFPAVIADFDRAWDLGLRSSALLTWRGTARLKTLDRAGGLADLKASVAQPDTTAWNHAWYGRALLTQFRDPAGVREMDRAAELAPKWPKVYAWRAEAKRHLGDLEGMDRDYKTALKLRPGRGLRDLLRGFRGMALLSLGRDDEAAAELRRALKATPRRTLWWHGLSTAMRRKGRLDRWIECLDAAARLDLKYENMPGGWKPAERESALRDLDALIAAKPRFTVARRWRAKLLLAAGRPSEARADLEAACRAEPKRAANQLWMAEALRASGDLDGAEAALARAARLRPRGEEISLARARVAEEKGDLARALAFYDAALKAEKRHAPAHAERGALLLALGRDREALAALETAAALSGRDARGWTDLSVARRRTGDAAGAEAALAKARALDAETADRRLGRWPK